MTDPLRNPTEQVAADASARKALPSGHVSEHLRWLRAAVPAERLFAPRVCLLIRSPDGERVAVDREGRLPWADVELESSLSATAQGLARGLGLGGPDRPGRFEPLAALAGPAWWEENGDLGRLAPVWIVAAAPWAWARVAGLREVPIGSVDVAAGAAGLGTEPAAASGRDGQGDYIARVRRHIGTARIFYPWAGLALRDDAGRLLLVRLAEQIQWHCPGGGMEVHESPQATATRELAEETGLVARPGRLIGCFSRHVRAFANGDRIQGMAIFMQGTIEGGALRPDPTGEIDEMGWFAADGLPPLRPPWDGRVQLALTGHGPRFD